MGIFGVDVSNHQTSFDFTGWDFAILKASEGSNFKDRMFPTHLANARRAGCVVAAYHYVRTDPADYQVGNIEAVVPKDVPIILDIEDGAGGDPNHWRQLMNELRERGYTVPLIYLPRWYWNKIGQPDLSGFPPLWMSWYPDYVARPREEGIAMVPSSAWAPIDDIPVAIMQFTSSPFDQNYYPGSKSGLQDLLGGNEMSWDENLEDPLVPGQYFKARDWLTNGRVDAMKAKDFAESAMHMGHQNKAEVLEVKEMVATVLAKLDALETGGVSEERIAEIAVDAVDEKLGDK